MKHLHEDTIIRYALDTLQPAAARRAAEHLAGCRKCGEAAEEVRRTTRLLGTVNPVLSKPPGLIGGMASGVWPRIAAALVSGFLLGVLVSESLRPESTKVVQQRLLPQSPQVSALVVCDQVDLAVRVR